MQVELNYQEWQQVLGLLSEGPWRIANPLLMKIGEQLRVQPADQEPIKQSGPPNRADGKDSKEADHG